VGPNKPTTGRPSAAAILAVNAVGAAVGYAAPDHFFKRFRQLNGLSPIAYRNRPGAQIL